MEHKEHHETQRAQSKCTLLVTHCVLCAFFVTVVLLRFMIFEMSSAKRKGCLFQFSFLPCQLKELIQFCTEGFFKSCLHIGRLRMFKFPF